MKCNVRPVVASELAALEIWGRRRSTELVPRNDNVNWTSAKKDDRWPSATRSSLELTNAYGVIAPRLDLVSRVSGGVVGVGVVHRRVTLRSAAEDEGGQGYENQQGSELLHFDFLPLLSVLD